MGGKLRKTLIEMMKIIINSWGGEPLLYNHIDMSEHMRIVEVRGRGLTDRNLLTVRSLGSDIDHVTYRTKPKRFLEIDFEVREGNKKDLRKKLDEISGFIVTKEQVSIVFSDESDRIYYGEYSGETESKEHH